MKLSVDKLVTTARETLESLEKPLYLTSFIASRQRGTLGALPEAVQHPEEPLLQKYVDKSIPLHTVLDWKQWDLERAIAKGPHTSTCTPEMTAFIRGEIRKRVQDGFIILLPATDAVIFLGKS